MSRDLGRDVPDLEKLYARKLWADFSYPTLSELLTDTGWEVVVAFRPIWCLP